jgi:hypothetical protein
LNIEGFDMRILADSAPGASSDVSVNIPAPPATVDPWWAHEPDEGNSEPIVTAATIPSPALSNDAAVEAAKALDRAIYLTQFEADEAKKAAERAAWVAKVKAAADRKAAHGNVSPPPTGATDDRAIVYMLAGKLDIYAEQCERLLGNGRHVYTRGGGLVRIGRAAELPNIKGENGVVTDDRGVKRDAFQIVCVEATLGWITRKLMKLATFLADTGKGGFKPDNCPSSLVSNILDQKLWQDVDPLITIATTPFLRPDMSVCDTPGYDAATGNYYQPSAVFPPILENPTRLDALVALNRLTYPFSEFPLSPAGRTVVMAHIMTLVTRPSFDTAPPFFYPAPVAGTGKTLLSRSISLLAHGIAAPERPWTEKEELRKVLLSVLIAGDTAIHFDNVPNGSKIRSAELARFVTSPQYADRFLGLSKSGSFANRTTICLTGNSITPVGDMARRSLVAELDADSESALGRDFTIKDLPAYILEHRPQLVVDVLTIIRAFHLAGRPGASRPMESFVDWSKLIRDPLTWLGMADPIETQATGTDDELAPLRAAFDAIATVTAHLDHTFTTLQLATLCMGGLRDVLLEAGCKEPSNAKELGYWLRGANKRVAGKWKLLKELDTHTRAGSWTLKAR